MAIAHEDVIRSLDSFAVRDFNVSTIPQAKAITFVQTMTTVARSKDLYIRRAAFRALRRFEDRASFPVLVDALDDQDQSIRYDAMVTLCLAMKAPDSPCPAVSQFRSDEQKYIGRIRAWWTTQQ